MQLRAAAPIRTDADHRREALPGGEDQRPRGGLRPLDGRLLRRVSAARWAIVTDIGAGVAGTLLLLAQITLLATLIAGAAQRRWLVPPTGLVIGLLAVVFVRAALAAVVEVSGRRAAVRVMSSLRRDLVACCLRRSGRPLASAEVATAAVAGVDGLETYFARYLPQLVLAVMVPASVLVWSAVIDPISAGIMLLTLPVIPILLVLIGRSASARARSNWQALVLLSSHFLDVVRGLPTLRAFNRGQAQLPRIRETTEQYRQTTMATLRLSFLSGVVLDLATTVSTALVAVTLGVRLVEGTVALQPALIVLLLVPELYASIRAVGTLFHASTDGLAAAERILDVLDGQVVYEAPIESSASDALHRLAPDPALEPIAIRSATVWYPGRSQPALDSVDVDIRPRELLAVVGSSGAGKTTLARVVMGFARPNAGSVLIGDEPLRAIDPEQWRARLAWAPQHPCVVHGSVGLNIALGRPDATMAEIEGAAHAAGAHAFIDHLPDGYDTLVGGGGRGLSAGQRQRLGLARALLRDASLLILDEPTVHLDDASVMRVTRTVKALRGSRTILLITHDMRLAALADRVLKLEAGRLTSGIHRAACVPFSCESRREPMAVAG